VQEDAGPWKLLLESCHALVETEGRGRVGDQPGGEEGRRERIDLFFDIVHDGLKLGGGKEVVFDEKTVVEKAVELSHKRCEGDGEEV
jgi:hypothetical protein